MEKTVKITNSMVLTAIKALIENEEIETVETPEGVVVSGQDIVSYCDTTLTHLANKAQKAKEKAAEKRAEGDALREEVQKALTDAWQTRDAITAIVNEDKAEPVSVNKVGARLTQLVDAEIAVKDMQKVGERKLTVYRLATAVDAE